jgi:cellulose synthase (UDP-forming)
MQNPQTPPASPVAGVPFSQNHQHPKRAAHWIELAITIAGLGITLIAIALFLRESFNTGLKDAERSETWALVRLGIFVLVVLLLVYGNIIYQLCRLGYLSRTRRHRIRHRDEQQPSVRGEPLVVLVPSYMEDLRTMRQTLLSAALQDYPNRRVVLLLDDPINQQSLDEIESLDAARKLPDELNRLLRGPRRYIESASALFRERLERGALDMRAERKRLLNAHQEMLFWFSQQGAVNPSHDHTDELFNDLTFRSHHDAIKERIAAMRRDLSATLPDAVAISRAYDALAVLFQAEISSFERKRYVNLSHAPNKAANLNAYLGLIGRSVQEQMIDGQLHLVDAGLEADNALNIPDATYSITLDADSLLRIDYARRLTAVMEAPGHERFAVVQTPYTAIPGAPSQLERIAGATTDIQYVIHQGFTQYNATFWVGANALIRMDALRDIQGEEEERGFNVPVYIKDRTVIEDTESTIDLVAKGWTLHNYPERLAFSATPPDFGSLLIQRRRWANGGLLILPNLIRHGLSTLFERGKTLELFVRAHYLVSIAGTSLGLLVLLFLPLGKGFDSPWLPLTALPYFLLYARDLTQIGYRKSDVLRVYAFNLLLLPINLAGVLKSLQQGVTGAKIPFGRTPKTEGRTAAPSWAIAAEWAMFFTCLAIAVLNAIQGQWGHAAFSMVTAIALAYAVIAFIGIRASVEDLTHPWTRLRRLTGS